jgi:signal peptidase I
MTRVIVRLVYYVVIVIAAGFWLIVLRPSFVGGPATYVIVRGDSMLPLHATGDLVVTQAASEYGIGDVVAYRVPEGEVGAGHTVLHRLVAGDIQDGFVARGDHNPAPDPWRVPADDISGREWVAFPWIGRWIVFIHQPAVLAALAAAIAVGIIVARAPDTEMGGAGPVRRSPSQS